MSPTRCWSLERPIPRGSLWVYGGRVDFSARRALLLDAIDTALKGLATLPQDADVVGLIADAQKLRGEVERWTSTPVEEEIARAEKRAWALNVRVADARRS